MLRSTYQPLDLFRSWIGKEIDSKRIITGETEAIGRYLGCEDRMITATIPQGSNPCHGNIPEPAPKVKTPKPFSDDDNVRALQVKQRAEGSKRNTYYASSHTPSTNIVKVNIISHDTRHAFSACVDQYLKLSKSTENM